MTAVAEAPTFAGAGVYANMPDDVYHADPVPGGSLSSSGAKKLLAPSCPAIFRYEQTHRVNKRAFDLGHAAHKKVLGIGNALVTIDYDSYNTKDSRAQRDAAYDAGLVPVLRNEMPAVDAMAAEIARHEIASRLFDPLAGMAEQSVIWLDDEYGIWRRARFDWTTRLADGRFAIVDLKTTTCAEPTAFQRSASNLGYPVQAAWYPDAAKAVGLDDDPVFLFVAIEKDPPHLITVFAPDADFIDEGRARSRRALEIFRDCRDSGIWPGYTRDIEPLSLPRYARRITEETW